MSEETTKLLLLEILGNIKIRDAIVNVSGTADKLTFTNQAGKDVSFDLQNLDVDKLIKDISEDCKSYTKEGLQKLKEGLEKYIADLKSNSQKSLEKTAALLTSNVNSLKKSCEDKINQVSVKSEKNFIEGKTFTEKKVEESIKNFTVKIEKVSSDIDLLQKNKTQFKEEQKNLKEVLDELKSSDVVQNVRVNKNFLFVKKNDKEKKYVLPSSSSYVSGGAPEFFYTNTQKMEKKVGGIPAGTTFQKASLESLWSMLLYGEDDPYFSSFVIDFKPEYEVGEPISGVKTAYWGITNTKLLEASSISLKYETGNVVIADNLDNSGSYSFTTPDIVFYEYKKVDFGIYGTTTTENVFSDFFSFYYKHRIYAGNSELQILTQDALKQLQLTDLADTIDGKYPIAERENSYKWICYPAIFGHRENFRDTDTDIDIEMSDPINILVTNQFGIQIDYLCYRTFYKLASALEIEVSQ